MAAAVVLILALLGIIRSPKEVGLINAVVITSVNLSSTRVGTVVISYGACLLVVAIAVRSRNSKMTNINSGINFNKVLF